MGKKRTKKEKEKENLFLILKPTAIPFPILHTSPDQRERFFCDTNKQRD
jgi:hypothetical protein